MTAGETRINYNRIQQVDKKSWILLLNKKKWRKYDY